MADNFSSEFSVGTKVVYPAHGVGIVRSFKKQEIAGTKIESIEIFFSCTGLTIQVPKGRVENSGLRILCSMVEIAKARKTLKGKVRTSRGMWSKRAKEYETKINSGCVQLLSEVVRDLHKNVDDPDRSYSERIIYENALGRLSREFCAVEEKEESQSRDEILEIISVHSSGNAKVDAKPILDDLDDFEEFEDDEFEESEDSKD